MSREIDPEAIAAGTLSDDEVEYLRVRGKLPADYTGAEERDEEWETGNRAAMTPRMKPRSTPLEEQSVPQFSGGAIDDDGDDSDSDYEEGWNNQRRRDELARRGLSVSGGKDDLIGRLKRSDSGQLTEDDEAS